MFDRVLLNTYLESLFPASIYPLKVNNRNTRTRCETFSKLTIKTPERRQLYTPYSCVSIVNFEQVNADWVLYFRGICDLWKVSYYEIFHNRNI